MEHPPDPTVQRHRLRMELRRARENANLARRQAATNLGWSESKLVRIEAGQVGISRTDLKALLELYGVNSSEKLTELAELAQQSRRQPWNAYRDVLNAEFVVYLGYESVACRLRSFQPEVIHGLLQTEDYAQGVIRAVAPSTRPEETIKLQVEARMKRQVLLGREDDPELSFILDESAVRRLPGPEARNREVMRAQLDRLKELGRLPKITIQILQFSHGFHYGSNGPFTILEFPGGNGGVVYMEGSRPGSMIREEADDVQRYDDLFEELAAAATQPGDLDRYLDEVML
jgi:transcriptional regulator with XRE-family HTH domain